MKPLSPIQNRLGAWAPLAFGSLLIAQLAACTPASGRADSGQEQKSGVPDELKQYVKNSLPKDIEHRTYIDYDGKVQLLGYDVSPSDVAGPGDRVTLRLYWQSSAPLGEEWKLFTHLLKPNGDQLAQVDTSGPLRTQPGGSPGNWEPGKIYVDEQVFEVPRMQEVAGKPVSLTEPSFTIATGLWRDIYRLPVLSGPADRSQRGLVTTLKTGITRPKPKALSKQEAEKPTG